MKALCTGILFSLFNLIAVVTMADDGFVPVDPSTLEQVSGKKLMMICYGIIVGVILLYTLFLFVRERSCKRQIDFLSRSIKK